ncbi:hypothetical protein ACHWQZ_G004392 [Mnemiopsis leidyi]
MPNGSNICVPPLSEVCAIIGNRECNEVGIGTSDHLATPCALLSVITPKKVFKSFQNDPELSISSSISWSVLKNLPMFCFPHGAQIWSKRPKLKIEYGVFTDETGSRIYMYCLCLPKDVHTSGQSTDSCMFSLTKLCFFSSHKCFTLMRDIFQTLSLQLINVDRIEFEVQILLGTLSEVFVPPKGTLDVRFGYKNKSFALNCELVAGFSDVPLLLPFMFFDHQTFIEILVAIISEQQVVFVSSDPSTRVLIMECFLSSIYPFEWLAPYFPLLTENLYDMLDAMGYFIFGADRSVLEEDHDDRRIIFIDIDSGTVNYCNGATRFNLDPTIVARFKERLPRTSFNFVCSSITEIFESEEDMLKAKEEFDYLLNVRIFLSIQYVLIDLYKGLLTFRMSAKKKISITQKTECDGHQLTPLQMHLKYTMMRANLRQKYNNPYLERQCFALLDVLKLKPIEHVIEETKINKRCNEVINFTHSVDDNLKSVELKLSVCERLSDKSSLLYLRALLLLRKEETTLAFQSINKIFEAGVKNFPALEVLTLLKKLEHFPDLYSELLKQDFMQQAVWAPLTMELGPENAMKSLSNKNYNYLEFPEIIMEMGITRYHETARKIFSALKSDSDQVLGQDAKNFCEIWGGLKKYLDRRVYLPMITNKSEKLVKYSEQNDKIGTGLHLICSIYKLYFVDIATRQICDFINIDEITDIRASMPTQLRFKLMSRSPKQIDNIKNACRWIIIIEELIEATRLFKKTKDQSILADARAGILIFESLHKYELMYGELLNVSDAENMDEQSPSCNFFVKRIKHTNFLTYQEKLIMMHKTPGPTISNVSGIDNVLCKFSPNPKIKETIEVLVVDSQYLYIGTRTCSLHKVSMTTFDVEAHISMMLPDNENWTLYEILLIEGDLWIAVKYKNKSLSRSLHIMKCDSFDNYQTLSLFSHNDHIMGMKRIENRCFITSMDGLTSIWCVKTKSMLQSVKDSQNFIFMTQIRGSNLLQSVKEGFSVYYEDEFQLHETGFTLIKFIVCEELGHIYGIDKASPDTIRCFSSHSFVHLKDLDICNVMEKDGQRSFYNLVLHGKFHLVLATRNISLLVYDLQDRCFKKSVSHAHTDMISCMTTTDDDKIITGSRSVDGTVTVWVDMFQD